MTSEESIVTLINITSPPDTPLSHLTMSHSTKLLSAFGDDSDNEEKRELSPIPTTDTYKPMRGITNDRERLTTEMEALPDACNIKDLPISIDDFAMMAMKGMRRSDGSQWNEGEPLHAGGMLEAQIPLPKQQGAGLGSDRSQPVLAPGQSNLEALKPKPGEFRNYVGVSQKLQKQKVIETGARVIIATGPHEGQDGIITSCPETGSALRKKDKIEIQLSSSSVQVTQTADSIRLWTKADSQRSAAKNKFSPEVNRPVKRRKEKPLEWVIQPGMLVRVISKGDLYNQKLVVHDIVSTTAFTLIDSSHHTYDHLDETDVETVIPRQQGSSILILSGKRKGAVALLSARDKKTSEVIVRFKGSLKDHRFSFDDVCSMG